MGEAERGALHRFEDLDAWQRSRGAVKSVYSLCRGNELCRDFGLRDQLQRAAVSIMTNIAEGFERKHVREKLQFYNVARGSCGEVRSLLYVVQDNYPALAEQAASIRSELAPIGQIISGLIRSTERRI